MYYGIFKIELEFYDFNYNKLNIMNFNFKDDFVNLRVE